MLLYMQFYLFLFDSAFMPSWKSYHSLGLYGEWDKLSVCYLNIQCESDREKWSNSV